jgi:hypothetical protein
VENHVKRKGRCRANDSRSVQLSSDFKTYLFKVPLYREDQRGQGGKRLESPQIRIGSILKGREWKLVCNKREEASGGEVRG